LKNAFSRGKWAGSFQVASSLWISSSTIWVEILLPGARGSPCERLLNSDHGNSQTKWV
jgi:hypothetical protein